MKKECRSFLKYKGIRPPTCGCSACRKGYRLVQAAKRERARKYAQELRDTRKRLNIVPLPRIPVDISK